MPDLGYGGQSGGKVMMRQLIVRWALAAAMLLMAVPLVYLVGNLVVKGVVGLIILVAAYRLVLSGLAERDT